MLAGCGEGGGGWGADSLRVAALDIHMKIASICGTAPNIGPHFRDRGKLVNAIIFDKACIIFYSNYFRMNHQIRQYEGLLVLLFVQRNEGKSRYFRSNENEQQISQVYCVFQAPPSCVKICGSLHHS